MRLLLLIFLCFMAFTYMKCQDVIHLTNPSFEDKPRASKPPKGWHDCGFPYESAPDTHPSGEFGVSKMAYDGDTYLGLVVRDIDSWESVGQELSSPLKKGKVYKFSLKLCKSSVFISIDRGNSSQTVNYTTPAVLRIYGTNDFKKTNKELLWQTEAISSVEWEEHICLLKPTEDWNFLILEAYYKTPTLFTYNGNILVDDCSSLVAIDTLSKEQIDSIRAVRYKKPPLPRFQLKTTKKE